MNKKIITTSALCAGISIATLGSTEKNIAFAVSDVIDSTSNRASELCLGSHNVHVNMPVQEMVVIQTKELSWSPLAKKDISSTLSNLLGKNQASAIIELYNSQLKEKAKEPTRLTYRDIEELKIPLVFDELKEVFPRDIWLFLVNNPSIVLSQDQSTPVIFVVKRKKTGRYALAYYNGGILRLATHASPGKKSGVKTGKKWQILPGGIPTPEGTYSVQYKERNKTSRKFENASMPFALNVRGGIFIHTGNTDGNPQSHWCIRIPGLYARELYNMVDKWSWVVVSFSGVNDISKENNPFAQNDTYWEFIQPTIRPAIFWPYTLPVIDIKVSHNRLAPQPQR